MNEFKFHYDSINSYTFILGYMILVLNLNSIMILLIQFVYPYVSMSVTGFKFHYDSINSASCNTSICHLSIFKFHYDSINSHRKTKLL